MTRSLALAALVLAGVLASPRRADACVLDGVDAVAFGNYDVYANSDVQVAGAVRYYCLVSLSIKIDISTGSSGSYGMRKMTRVGGGTDTLSYQLFTDAARTTVWGNGPATSTGHYGPVIGLLVMTSIPIYGLLYKKQNVRTGSYTDTVIVTLNY